ncbi:MAG: superoxide dismutase [Bacilli bacterium]
MYKLPKLAHMYQDFEPFIDAHTMGVHYHKHEQTYLNNLNNLLNKNNFNYNYDIDELIYHINEFPDDDKENILFNLGGVINHELYWKGISQNNYLPNGKLKNKIDSQYGNFDNFWNQFKEMGLKLKGSGYTFLVLKNDKNLDIINLSNQDMPVLHGYIPLFNIDLWEHAYYLNYLNERGRYIDNFKNIADFTNASLIYDKIV